MDSNKMMTKQKALDLVSNYLGDQWKKVEQEDISLTLMSGGFSNTMYLLKIIESSNLIKIEPNAVIIRKFGGNLFSQESNDSGFSSKEQENLHYYGISMAGLGPHLYGLFKGGRIEGYIPSHTLTIEELFDENIRNQVATMFGRFHNIKLPISRVPLDYLALTQSFAMKFDQEAKEKFASNLIIQNYVKDMTKVIEFDSFGEVNWLQSIKDSIGGRIVFCQGDCNRNNVLVKDQPDSDGNRIMFIDYETTGMSYRGRDIANHFTGWLMGHEVKPDSNLTGLSYPDENIRKQFLQTYISEFRKIALETEQAPSMGEKSNNIDTVEQLMKEVDFWILPNSLFLISWLTGNLETTIKSPKFLGMVEVFIDLYNDRKEVFVKKYLNSS